MKHIKKNKIVINMLVVAIMLTITAMPAAAKSAKEIRDKKLAEIPICAKKYGAIVVEEPDSGKDWWTGAQLPAPSTLVKVYVRKSGCFDLIDRSAGFGVAQRERELAASGALRGQSNIGGGQIRAADYAMVPELASQNENAGGRSWAAIGAGVFGNNSLIGAGFGALNTKKKTADVVLSVVDVRSTEYVAMTEGHGEKKDVKWGVGGGLFTSGGIGGAGVGSYANTEIGQVVAIAYLNAFIDMVAQFEDLPDSASANNELQILEITRPARMLANPDGSGQAVRDLEVGMLLYPTGNKENQMWEVEDELGNRGWVNSNMFQLAK